MANGGTNGGVLAGWRCSSAGDVHLLVVFFGGWVGSPLRACGRSLSCSA